MLYNVTEQLKGAKTCAEEADRRALEAARRFRGAEEARVAGEGEKRRVDEVCVLSCVLSCAVTCAVLCCAAPLLCLVVGNWC
jgi:hypothetical protein